MNSVHYRILIRIISFITIFISANATMAEGGGGESELVIADVSEDQKQLICVEYPGIVDSDDKAITNLGGIETVAKAHFEKNQRLEVKLRPEDIYCKPVFSRATKVSNLVLRVKKRRRRTVRREVDGGGGEGEGGQTLLATPDEIMQQGEPKADYEYSAEVLGVVNTSYTFSGMADFQVLPPGLNSISHNRFPVNPKDFQMTEPLDDSFVSRDLPSFLPPTIFSKFDRPTNYGFHSESKPKLEPKEGKLTLTTKLKNRAHVTAYAIPFDYRGPIPTKPHPNAQSSSYTVHPKLQLLKELFEERPIWSRLALDSKLKIPQSPLRSLLALVAYNVTSGPWRTLWVKFGYDPREDPSSKVYQCMDFRLPKEVDSVEARRKMGVQSQPGYLSKRLGEEDSIKLTEEKSGADSDIDNMAYIFTADRLPQQRQLFYQLCDLREEGLQKIIHSNDGKETVCSETNGWCEENTYERLRKALVDLTKKTAERIKAGELSGASTHPSSSSTVTT